MFHPEGPSLASLARQALSSTRRGYDLLAPRFDRTPFRTPPDLLEQVFTRVGTVDRALDVCCGTGAAMIALRPHVRQELVGIDFSPGMLEEARRRVGEAPGDAPARFVLGDVLEMGFDAEFDLATSFGAFGHIVKPDQPRFLRNIHRALRPGGRFVFVTSEPPPRLDRRALIYRAFNGVMRVRNRLLKPRFVMYYLNFLLPDAVASLREAGFRVEVEDLPWRGRPVKLVTATRPTR